MWLASVSRSDKGGHIIPNHLWSTRQCGEAAELLTAALEGVGDPSRERCFRMLITVCLHRGLTREEEDHIHACGTAVDLAGPPLEILWARGVERTLSAEPCANPRRLVLEVNRYGDIWVPRECGVCESCVARRVLEWGADGIPKNGKA